jgi:hypothetical protein
MINLARLSKPELARFPRGATGSLQNLFRMVWWNVRMNSLGRKPEVGRSLAEVDDFALQLMRSHYPGFELTFA